MIVCIGEAVIDMFQKNISGLGEVFMPLPGGCTYNTSIAIGALGVPAAFVGRISHNFFGDIQVKRLNDYNVKNDLLIRCAENPILAFIKTEEGRQPQYAFYDEGTSDKLLSTGELPQLPLETSCIVFGSISMNMEPIATTIETLILNEASKNINERKIIAFDPNIRPFMIKNKNEYIKRFSGWVCACTIAKISSEDFEYIYPDTEPQAALNKIIDLGARLAIVTLGPDGAIALHKHEDGSVIKIRADGIQIPQIADTVGAGDTFLGAFLARLAQKGKMTYNAIVSLNEFDLRDALSFANKAAAIVCTRYGANPPSMKEIERGAFSIA